MRQRQNRAVAAASGLDAAIGMVNGILLSLPLWGGIVWLAAAF